MENLKFDFVFLGQSVLKYQVPLDIFTAINQIYEQNYNNLAPANDQLVDSAAGLFGSKIFTHNIYNKSYEVSTYDYFENFDDYGRTDPNASFPKYNETDQKYVDSRIYVHPTNESEDNDIAHGYNVTASKLKDSLLSRKARMHEIFSGKKIGLTVHGTVGICVGKMIGIKYFKHVVYQ